MKLDKNGVPEAKDDLSGGVVMRNGKPHIMELDAAGRPTGHYKPVTAAGAAGAPTAMDEATKRAIETAPAAPEMEPAAGTPNPQPAPEGEHAPHPAAPAAPAQGGRKGPGGFKPGV